MQFVLIKMPKPVRLHKEMLDSVKWREGREADNIESTEQPK